MAGADQLIELYYPKAIKKGGWSSYLLVTMLRIHLLQQLYSLRNSAI